MRTNMTGVTLLLLSTFLFYAHFSRAEAPKNVILIIGDGMGFEYVNLARIFMGNQKLSFEQFPYQSEVTTCNKEGSLPNGKCNPKTKTITDSAASATAIATGEKVSNDVISLAIPGDGKAIKTILEIFKEKGRSTGLVTTKLITDATPACFGAHNPKRDNELDILKDYLYKTTPNVLFGADLLSYRDEVKKSPVKYQIITKATELNSLLKNIQNRDISHIYGGFGQYALIPNVLPHLTGLPLEITDATYFKQNDIPHLSEMAQTALTFLAKNDKGFFLMVESGQIDLIGHSNPAFPKNNKSPTPAASIAAEMAELDKTVKLIHAFAKNRNDTLVLVTADHETGGLELLLKKTKCMGKQQCIPEVKWNAPLYPEYNAKMAQHTAKNVPVYAFGVNAKEFGSQMNNTDFVQKILVDSAIATR